MAKLLTFETKAASSLRKGMAWFIAWKRDCWEHNQRLREDPRSMDDVRQ